MENTNKIIDKLQSGAYNKILSYLHPGMKNLSSEQQRYSQAIQKFNEIFGENREIRMFSAPGRTEIGGNHTDHQHGCVVAASIDLDIIAIVSPRDDNQVCFHSEGFSLDQIDLNDLSIHPEEINRSESLIRGTAAGFKEKGLKFGGFDAYSISNVLKGSGLSSSAAFEVMIGTIQNYLYNNNSMDPVLIAQLGQYAENVYFDKPSGLLDQTACSVGGYVAIDFYDPAKPIIEKINFDFSECGHTMCIIDTGGSHTDLTHEYASVVPEMKSVAHEFQKEFLRDVPADEFYKNVGSLRGKVSDRAILRAFHFFDENLRAQDIAQTLREKDFERFKVLSNASGRSSFMYLQNVYSSSSPHEQGLSVALAAAEHLLHGRGSMRVHGGGFAGTIQVFVPTEIVGEFKMAIEKVTGIDTCHLLSVRPVGGIEIA